MSTSSLTERLADRIAAFDAELAKQLPANVLEGLRAAFTDIAAAEAGRGAPRIGAVAPPFNLPDARGGRVSLQDQLERGPVVIAFYRGAWCPYCDLTLRAYQDLLPQRSARSAQVSLRSRRKPPTRA